MSPFGKTGTEVILKKIKMEQIKKLQQEITPLRNKLLNHRLYSKIETLEDLKIFTQHHVFAVWDFMSLLKAMQAKLTCVSTPWYPVGSARTRRMINEIVLGEETDVDSDGNPASHFELYVDAMLQYNASVQQINQLINAVINGKSIDESLQILDVSAAVKEFVQFTFAVVNENKIHKIAAVFTFGREDLIPDLFRGLVADLNMRFPNKLGKMIYYLDRHIEVDDGVHGPMALQMMEELCANDQVLWAECISVSKMALEKRIALWDAIAIAIEQAKVLAE